MHCHQESEFCRRFHSRWFHERRIVYSPYHENWNRLNMEQNGPEYRHIAFMLPDHHHNGAWISNARSVERNSTRLASNCFAPLLCAAGTTALITGMEIKASLSQDLLPRNWLSRWKSHHRKYRHCITICPTAGGTAGKTPLPSWRTDINAKHYYNDERQIHWRQLTLSYAMPLTKLTQATLLTINMWYFPLETVVNDNNSTSFH